MSSPRKHPSRYPSRLTDLLLGPSIILTLPSARAAINLRYHLYSFRESLRAHPDYNPHILAQANATLFKLRSNELHITKLTALTRTANHEET